MYLVIRLELKTDRVGVDESTCSCWERVQTRKGSERFNPNNKFKPATTLGDRGHGVQPTSTVM